MGASSGAVETAVATSRAVPSRVEPSRADVGDDGNFGGDGGGHPGASWYAGGAFCDAVATAGQAELSRADVGDGDGGEPALMTAAAGEIARGGCASCDKMAMTARGDESS